MVIWIDPTTNRVNMGARWYTPGTATFTARGAYNRTHHHPHSLQPVHLRRREPIRYTDPTGRCFEAADAAALGIIIEWPANPAPAPWVPPYEPGFIPDPGLPAWSEPVYEVVVSNPASAAWWDPWTPTEVWNDPGGFVAVDPSPPVESAPYVPPVVVLPAPQPAPSEAAPAVIPRFESPTAVSVAANLMDAVDRGLISGLESSWLPEDYYDWSSPSQVSYLEDLANYSGLGQRAFSAYAGNEIAAVYRDAHSRGLPIDPLPDHLKNINHQFPLGVCPVTGCYGIGLVRATDGRMHFALQVSPGLAVSSPSLSIGQTGAYDVGVNRLEP